jgi:hypothetical protein
MKTREKIIKHLSLTYYIPVVQVEHAIYAQFRFIRDMIRAGEFKSARLIHFVIFAVKPGRIKYYGDKRRDIKATTDLPGLEEFGLGEREGYGGTSGEDLCGV